MRAKVILNSVFKVRCTHSIRRPFLRVQHQILDYRNLSSRWIDPEVFLGSLIGYVEGKGVEWCLKLIDEIRIDEIDEMCIFDLL